jgi:hypothetical protein
VVKEGRWKRPAGKEVIILSTPEWTARNLKEDREFGGRRRTVAPNGTKGVTRRVVRRSMVCPGKKGDSLV